MSSNRFDIIYSYWLMHVKLHKATRKSLQMTVNDLQQLEVGLFLNVLLQYFFIAT